MATETTDEPIVLLDQGEDGYCEDHGWVEATVDEGRARILISTWTLTPDGNGLGGWPVEPATRAWLRPSRERGDWWIHCDARDNGAVEFWQFDVSTAEARAPLSGGVS